MIASKLQSLSGKENNNIPKTMKAIRGAMAKENEVFANINQIAPSLFKKQKAPQGAKIDNEYLGSVMFNYYMTDSISRNSPSMAKCTKAIAALKKEGNQDSKILEEV